LNEGKKLHFFILCLVVTRNVERVKLFVSTFVTSRTCFNCNLLLFFATVQTHTKLLLLCSFFFCYFRRRCFNRRWRKKKEICEVCRACYKKSEREKERDLKSYRDCKRDTRRIIKFNVKTETREDDDDRRRRQKLTVINESSVDFFYIFFFCFVCSAFKKLCAQI
jgi:hypothetical protein